MEFWATRGIFDRHGGRVRLEVADALAPASVARGPLRAAFCNYILDTLPADTFRRTATGWERLNVQGLAVRRRWPPGLRPWHRRDPRPRACRRPAGAGPCAAVPRGRAAVLPGVGRRPGRVADRRAVQDVGQPVVFNHGALACVRALVALLQPGGFVLVNDYGVTRAETSAELGPVQWFGPAAATGLNFPLLERCCGAVACTPEGDDELAVHARLLVRDASPANRQEFADRFALAARRRVDALTERARTAAASGDWQQALRRLPGGHRAEPRGTGCCWRGRGVRGCAVASLRGCVGPGRGGTRPESLVSPGSGTCRAGFSPAPDAERRRMRATCGPSESLPRILPTRLGTWRGRSWREESRAAACGPSPWGWPTTPGRSSGTPCSRSSRRQSGRCNSAGRARTKRRHDGRWRGCRARRRLRDLPGLSMG